MQVNCHITRKTDCRYISEKEIKALLRKINKNLKLKDTLDVSLVFVGNAEIRKLNNKWRKKNKVTDVLSFPYERNTGEVVISCPQAVKQAKKLKVDVKNEFRRLITHGILHLIGYKHFYKKDKDKMEKLENKILYDKF